MFQKVLATLFAIATLVAGAKPCLAGQVTTATYDEGDTVEVKLPSWGGQVTVYTQNPGAPINVPSIAHVEFGLKVGYYNGGHDDTLTVMPNLGLSLRISENCFLRGTASVGLVSGGSMSDFGFGLGVWATDFVRLTFSAGQIVRRTASWQWRQGGPIGKVSADYFLSPNAFVGLEVFGGPSWDQQDQLSPAYGGGFGAGWRF